MDVQPTPTKPSVNPKRNWWVPSLFTTIALVPAGMVFIFVLTNSAMATDSCHPASSCPAAFHSLDLAEYLFAAAVIATLVQWVPAYWISRQARVLLAAVPRLLAAAAIITALNTPVAR